jgi:hypothetical protein
LFFRITIHLHPFAGTCCVAECLRGQGQQVCSQLLQRLGFVLVDIAALVLRKAEYEHPALAFVCGHQRPIAAAFSLSGSSDPLLVQPATQIGIHEAKSHFPHDGT